MFKRGVIMINKFEEKKDFYKILIKRFSNGFVNTDNLKNEKYSVRVLRQMYYKWWLIYHGITNKELMRLLNNLGIDTSDFRNKVYVKITVSEKEMTEVFGGGYKDLES